MGNGIKRGKGVYSYRKDRDKQGIFYLIFDPYGKCIAYVDRIEFARALVAHLNRE